MVTPARRTPYQILLKAAAKCTTIEASYNDSPGAPDSYTVRGYLNAQLPRTAIQRLEQPCNRALYHRWPHWLWSCLPSGTIGVIWGCHSSRGGRRNSFMVPLTPIRQDLIALGLFEKRTSRVLGHIAALDCIVAQSLAMLRQSDGNTGRVS